MRELKGIAASPGIAVGKLHMASFKRADAGKKTILDVEGERERFESARARAMAQLGELAVSMTDKIGAENALLFEIQQMMLEEPDFIDSVNDLIARERVCAEYAIQAASNRLYEQFSQVEDAYMRARAGDIKDAAQRVVSILSGVPQGTELRPAEPCIFVGNDFTPSETAQLEPGQVLALLTKQGAPNSHTAIISRTLGIPAVVGIGDAVQALQEGQTAIVDGSSGQIIIDPTQTQLEEYRKRLGRRQEAMIALEELKGKPNITKAGRWIDVYANIGSIQDAVLAEENDAGGIGLFRSEFLFLESAQAPTEDQQFKAYRAVLERMKGKRVVVRTLDLGADKQVPYLGMNKEENPALGCRALRLCLDRPDILMPQLRALFRASVYGKLAIMFPMVISAAEVAAMKRQIETVKKALAEENQPFAGDVEIGIMIETPAAALISDQLAREVDFFSVGTNDLTQYTLAIDRQNPKLTKFYDPYHEGVFRLIEMAARNIHREGRWIGICGELAADPACTKRFLNMGIDELSVSPPQILPLRRRIREL